MYFSVLSTSKTIVHCHISCEAYYCSYFLIFIFFIHIDFRHANYTLFLYDEIYYCILKYVIIMKFQTKIYKDM